MLFETFEKHLVLILLILVSISCSVEQNDRFETVNPISTVVQEVEVDKESNAELNLINRRVDFGVVQQDTLLVPRYDFTNSGTDTLMIHSVKPDCIFRGYTLSDETVAPGDTAYVFLELGIGQMSGYLRSYATIETNTYTKFYNLTLEAFIE